MKTPCDDIAANAGGNPLDAHGYHGDYTMITCYDSPERQRRVRTNFGVLLTIHLRDVIPWSHVTRCGMAIPPGPVAYAPGYHDCYTPDSVL